MKEFVKKMITEKDELSGRIKKNRKVIETPPYGSDAEGLRMLAEQVRAMESYRYWLEERIRHEEGR